MHHTPACETGTPVGSNGSAAVVPVDAPADTAVTRLTTGLTAASPLYFGQNITDHFMTAWSKHVGREHVDKVFLIVDEQPYRLNHSAVPPIGDSLECQVVAVSAGEVGKSWQQLTALCEQLVSNGASRRSVLVAFGGGSVGNLVGMTAGILFRGIRFVEIPTSFAHLTDGTLSNKQAINGYTGKNHFGLYHAPEFIWADTGYLISEPMRSRRAGLAESVKNSLVSGKPCCADLQRRLAGLDGGCADVDVHQLAWSSILAKLEILRADPTERYGALVLEYGHTFGHAIEWLADGGLLHGECVAVGMKLAARFSHHVGLITSDLVTLHDDLLDRHAGIVPPDLSHLSGEQVVTAMRRDNRRTGPRLRLVLLDGPGSCYSGGTDPLYSVRDESLLLGIVEAGLRRQHPAIVA